mmetsp:Transcript_63247/g.150860  ORF Transcript_63247/g.150860 Transcript_63247/m.150860 type:complete len:223 (+) Transcript_63247:173-841(+)
MHATELELRDGRAIEILTSSHVDEAAFLQAIPCTGQAEHHCTRLHCNILQAILRLAIGVSPAPSSGRRGDPVVAGIDDATARFPRQKGHVQEEVPVKRAWRISQDLPDHICIEVFGCEGCHSNRILRPCSSKKVCISLQSFRYVPHGIRTLRQCHLRQVSVGFQCLRCILQGLPGTLQSSKHHIPVRLHDLVCKLEGLPVLLDCFHNHVFVCLEHFSRMLQS